MSTRPTLELKVFPGVPDCPRPSDAGFAYEDWHSSRVDEMRLSFRKRLTDAELAAEFWSSVADVEKIMGNVRRGGKLHAVRVANTLQRFAVLPHYDEDGTA